MGIQGPGGGAYNPGPIKPTIGAMTTLPNGTQVPLNNVTNPQTAVTATQSSASSGPVSPGVAQYGGGTTPPVGNPNNMALLDPHAPAGPTTTAPTGTGGWNGTNPAFAGKFPGTGSPPPPAGSDAPPGEMFGPQFGEKYGMSHVGQYDQPTDFEKFAQQQMNGTNPYYDRLRQQGMNNINQQMVARGHGNSGGAFAALGNYGGAIDAAQFQDMANMLQGAGNQGLQREQQGSNLANQVQGMQDTRVQHQFGNLSDISHLVSGNTGMFYNQGGQQSGDSAMAGINALNNSTQLTGQGQQQLPNAVLQFLNGLAARK